MAATATANSGHQQKVGGWVQLAWWLAGWVDGWISHLALLFPLLLLQGIFCHPHPMVDLIPRHEQGKTEEMRDEGEGFVNSLRQIPQSSKARPGDAGAGAWKWRPGRTRSRAGLSRSRECGSTRHHTTGPWMGRAAGCGRMDRCREMERWASAKQGVLCEARDHVGRRRWWRRKVWDWNARGRCG